MAQDTPASNVKSVEELTTYYSKAKKSVDGILEKLSNLPTEAQVVVFVRDATGMLDLFLVTHISNDGSIDGVAV